MNFFALSPCIFSGGYESPQPRGVVPDLGVVRAASPENLVAPSHTVRLRLADADSSSSSSQNIVSSSLLSSCHPIGRVSVRSVDGVARHADRGLSRSNALRQGREGSSVSKPTGDCDQNTRHSRPEQHDSPLPLATRSGMSRQAGWGGGRGGAQIR